MALPWADKTDHTRVDSLVDWMGTVTAVMWAAQQGHSKELQWAHQQADRTVLRMATPWVESLGSAVADQLAAWMAELRVRLSADM